MSIQAALSGAATGGVAAVGGGTHLPIELFFKAAGIKTQPMPSKSGGSGVITSLVGGPFFVWMLIRNSRRQGVFA